MPAYGRRCLDEKCGWSREWALERVDARELPCPTCAGPTERVWMGAMTMIPDTFSTPLVDDVMAKHTQVFESRSDHRRAMEIYGVNNDVQHVGLPGSDKSPHTVSWMSGPPPGVDPRPMCLLSPEEQANRRAQLAKDEAEWRSR